MHVALQRDDGYRNTGGWWSASYSLRPNGRRAVEDTWLWYLFVAKRRGSTDRTRSSWSRLGFDDCLCCYRGGNQLGGCDSAVVPRLSLCCGVVV